MLGDELAAAANAGYRCPADVGPAWRQAMAEGLDMSLVERNLGRSPWERFRDHDRALALALVLEATGRRLHE